MAKRGKCLRNPLIPPVGKRQEYIKFFAMAIGYFPSY